MTQSPFRKSLVTAALALSALALLGVFQSATAQPSATPKTPTRVAIVNLAKVMDGLTEAKDAKTRLETMVADSKKRLDEINDRIKKIDTDLEMMKDKKETKEYRTFVYEKLELNANGEARSKVLQQLIDEEEGTTVRGMYLKMADAVSRLAARDGWDLVLRDDRDIIPPERTNQGQGRPLTGREVRSVIDQRSIITASNSIELTSQVTTMMNNEYKPKP